MVLFWLHSCVRCGEEEDWLDLGAYALYSQIFEVDPNIHVCPSHVLASYEVSEAADGELSSRSYWGGCYLCFSPPTLFSTYYCRVVSTGPFWGLLNQDYENCSQWWWTNLLYINTIVPWNNSFPCYAVSWYMSVDFQLFLILPFIVLIYVYHRPSGYLVSALLWLASTAYAFWLAIAKHDSEFAMSMDINAPNGYQQDYYFRAWTR